MTLIGLEVGVLHCSSHSGHHARHFRHWWFWDFEERCWIYVVAFSKWPRLRGGTTIRDQNDMFTATLSVMDVDVRGIVTWWALAAKPRPSCLHTTMASLMPQFSLQIEPQRLRPPNSIKTSTRPSDGSLPPASRTWKSIRLKGLNGVMRSQWKLISVCLWIV